MDLIVQVENINGVLVTTSNRVAEELGVLHKDLLEKIDNYINKFQSAELSADFYIPSKFKDNRNRTYRNYLITKKGIAQLVGGYSGAVEKAFDLNVAYINKFEEMENKLKELEYGNSQKLSLKIQELQDKIDNFPMTWVGLECIKDQIKDTIEKRCQKLNSTNRYFKKRIKKELEKDILLRFGAEKLVDLRNKDYTTIMGYTFFWVEPYDIRESYRHSILPLPISEA